MKHMRTILTGLVALLAVADLAIKLALSGVGPIAWQPGRALMIVLYANPGGLDRLPVAFLLASFLVIMLGAYRFSAPLFIGAACLFLVCVGRLAECVLWQCAGLDWIGVGYNNATWFFATNFTDILLLIGYILLSVGIIHFAVVMARKSALFPIRSAAR